MIISPPVRHLIRVRGTVQGVGFRPTVYRLATRCGLAGFVRNDGVGVSIEVEGDAAQVARFIEALRAEAPPLCRIDHLDHEAIAPKGERAFHVIASDGQRRGDAAIPADAATCDACLGELFTPGDRRFRYPFINCTDCGPRYTIVTEVPYDRERTTMAAFALCAACRAEYEDPGHRRFHAEPNACPECGPRLELIARGGRPLYREDALRSALERIAAGQIVAVKGLGGFFLAVDARNEGAVAKLRARKQRPHKPLALMARDVSECERIALLDDAARAELTSPARPIVLLGARPGNEVAPSVAPGLVELGVMLPYTPLHHLLLQGPVPLLVMTSGNLSEEPIARENEEAVRRLSAIADAFLLHNRVIHTRADDSVVRISAGAAQPVRRARGYVPHGIDLGFEAPPVLAVGAELKNTVCLTRGGEAFLSPHLGNLENAETHAFFVEVIAKLERLLSIAPVAVAHDLHPDYLSTRWARASGLPTIPVQHHHAHVASCLAEHKRTNRVIGVAFDGTGCGPAGDLWGGEFLLADLAGFTRVGHLRPIALPGGEAAIREPWRLACAALLDAEEPLDALARVGARRVRLVQQLSTKRAVAPLATGAGRWFDAVSALCGVRDVISYEGQAAIELEACAGELEADPYPHPLAPGRPDEPFSIDLRPLVRAVAADVRAEQPVAVIAARFHEAMAGAIVKGCLSARERQRVDTVVLSGGCFQNKRLTERSRVLLEREGFEVLVHRRVPPNDGGVSLGQAAVAGYRLQRGAEAGDVSGDSR